MDVAVFNDEPGATTGVEDFRPGDEVEWSFYHDEVQYILKGKAEFPILCPRCIDVGTRPRPKKDAST
jgi:hypothetical protein